MDWEALRKEAREERPGNAGLLGTAATMGLHMVTGPAVGAALGWLADSWLGSFPWGSGTGFTLGTAAGFRNVWADARWLARSNEKNSQAEKTGDSHGTNGAPKTSIHSSRADAVPAAPEAAHRQALVPDAPDFKTEPVRCDKTAALISGTPPAAGGSEADN